MVSILEDVVMGEVRGMSGGQEGRRVMVREEDDNFRFIL